MAEKKCNNCGTDKAPASVPYVVHESTVARMERIIKRQWIALIVAIALIFASNAIWIYCWMQYDYTSTTEEIIYQQDGQGTNIIGNSNEVDNGSESDDTQENTNTP